MNNRIIPIAKKEFLHIFRDSRVLITVLIMPLIQLFLFSYALSFDIKDVKTVMLNQDQSSMSRKLVTSFTKSGYFNVVSNASTQNEIDHALDSGQAVCAVVIPPGFGSDVNAGRESLVQVLVDGSDPTISSVSSGYSAAIVQQFGKNLGVKYLTKRGVAVSGTTPINLNSRVWYNPERTGVNYIIPGLIAVIMMGLTVTQTAVALVREKDQKTIEQIIVSPIKRYELMLGKVLPYLALAALDVLLISLVGIYWFGVPFRGSVFLMGISSVLFVFGTLGLGLIVSAVSNSLETANQLSSFVSMLPTFLLSGFVFPIASMPIVLRLLTYFVPARYYINILRGIFLKGVGLNVLWPDFLGLIVFSIFTIGVSSVVFKKKV